MHKRQIVPILIASVSILLSYVGLVLLGLSADNAPHPSIQENIASLFHIGWFGGLVVMIAIFALPCLWVVFRPQKVTLFDSLVVAMPVTIWGLFLFNIGAFTAIIRLTV